MSKNLESENSVKTKGKEHYILFFFAKNSESEISFEFDSKKTETFYSLKEKNNGIFRTIVIIKHIVTPKNSSQIVNLSFKNKEEIFKINFNANEGTFIFNPTLKIQRNIFSNEKAFSQSNVIKNKDKVYIFKKCLEEKKEESKIPILFNDAVELFKLNQDFDLIAFLFTQVCDINKGFKEVCKKLLTAFWDKASKDINNPNGDSKSSQMNNLSDSNKVYFDKIKEIISKSEEIIKDIGLDKTKFYGFILFYLNTYDNKLFQELSEKLQEQMEKEKETFFFDILAHFSSTFSNDIKLNLENYMDYLMGKDFKSLDTLGFSYFKLIEDFIHVIFKKEEFNYKEI